MNTATVEKIWTMDDIVTASNQNKGSYFSKDTMRFWSSRLCHSSVRQGQGGIFFVISNKEHNGERVYRVSMWCPIEMRVRGIPRGYNQDINGCRNLRTAIRFATYLANEDKVTRVQRIHEENEDQKLLMNS